MLSGPYSSKVPQGSAVLDRVLLGELGSNEAGRLLSNFSNYLLKAQAKNLPDTETPPPPKKK